MKECGFLGHVLAMDDGDAGPHGMVILFAGGESSRRRVMLARELP